MLALRPLVPVLAALLGSLALAGGAAAAELPLAGWHLDAAGPDRTPDYTGHGNDLFGDVDEIGPGGRWGGAVLLEEGDSLYRANATGLEPGAVTVLAWVKASSSPGAVRYVLAKGGSAGCAASSYALYAPPGGGIAFYVTDSGGKEHLSPAAAPAQIWNGQWHAVAGSYDGSTVRLYVDGAEVGSGTAVGKPISYALESHDLRVGDYPREGCGSHSFSGWIDEARIYGRALSATEVALLSDPAATSPPELPNPATGGGPGGSAGSPVVSVAARGGEAFRVKRSTLGGAGTAWLSAKGTLPSPGARIERFLWDFDGNGTTDAICPPEAPAVFHQYGRTGRARAVVSAEDSSGAMASAATQVSLAARGGKRGTSVSRRVADASAAKPSRRQLQATACITQADEQQPSSADCVRSFQFGVVDVNARSENCFALESEVPATREGAARSAAGAVGGLRRYYDASVKGSVALNGIPIPLPNGFRSTYSSKDGSIGLGRRSVSFDVGGRRVRIGSLDLQRRVSPLAYPGGVATYRLGAIDLAGLGKIGGLGADGSASLDFLAPGETRLNVSVRLPTAFSLADGRPAEGNVAVLASNTRPFRVGELRIRVPSVFMGPVLARNLELAYSEQGDTWSGGAGFVLPATDPPFELDASPKPGTDYGVRFSGGQLQHAGAEVAFGALAPQVFPGVFLSHLRFAFGTGPTRLFGGGALNTAKLAYVNGNVLMVFPEPGERYVVPAGLQGFQRLTGRSIDSLSVGGGGDLSYRLAGFDLPLGNAFLLYTYPGKVEFGGGVDVPLGVFHASGEATGFVDLASRRMNAEGRGRFCIAGIDGCIGVQMLVSTTGIAGCGEMGIEPVTVSVGAGYRWNGELHVYPYGCDVGPYRVYAGSSALASAAQGFTLKPNLPFAAIEVKGAGGAPDLTLRGPKGQTFSTAGRAEGIDGGFAFLRVDANGTSYLGLRRPAAGRWTVTANPGSVPLASLTTADGLRPAKVEARVTRDGAGWALSYEVAPRPGHRVSFVETGADTYRQLGTAKGRRGTLRFKPAFGSAGKRRVLALVEAGGVVTDRLRVATYRAPGWRHPRRPQGLRAQRRGAVVKVSWGAQPGVKRWVVSLRTADGLGRMVLVRKPKATLRGVPTALAATVTVAGLEIDGTRGPTRQAKLRG